MTNQDINNLKRTFLHLNESVEQKVFCLLDQFVQVDANNVACVVLDDEEKGIELIFLQSNSQRECFKKFPELILLDLTCTVRNGKSLIVKELPETIGSNRQVEENHVGENMEFDPPLILSNDF